MGIIQKLGLIGTGMYGQLYLKHLQVHPEAEVVHIANRGEESRLAAQKQYGIARASADAMDLINDPAVEAVIIATPPYKHAEYALAALRAGKHILLEKPMAAQIADARAIVAAVKSRPDLVVLEASCRHTRLHAKFRFIKDFIDSGKIGKIYHIHQQYVGRSGFFEYNPNGAAWCLDRALAGGGQTADMGEYDLSFHLGLIDDQVEVERVHAMAVKGLRDYPGHEVSVEQHAKAWLECSGGLTYSFERGGPVHMDIPEETRIYGSRGGLRFAYQTWMPWSFEWYYDGPDRQPVSQRVEIPKPADHDDEREICAHFIDCLQGRAKPLMTVDLALKHFLICQEIIAKTKSV